ncbi:MAG TPA: hypothetical protein VGS22_01310 [Thermoanaerobaculia bacterium]|jgi:hypothetical protein|nr:hypothetical protein [Thermoanaerobaculia bacterium]
MFLSSRAGARWRNVGLLAMIAAVAAYARAARGGFSHGGSTAGIVFGALGLAAILALLFFGVRKRDYKSRLGRLETWLHIHVYLGLLSFVLILLHSGFRFHDQVAVSAFVVLILVVATGVWGALLYQRVPRLLSEVQTNLPADEISEQLNQLARSMARLAGERSAPFREVYRVLLAEAKPGVLAGWRSLFRKTSLFEASGTEKDGKWQSLFARIAPEEQEELRRLLVLSRQHRALYRRFVIQQRYRNLLQVWLYLHVPLSIALLAAVAAHLIAVFYFWGA